MDYIRKNVMNNLYYREMVKKNRLVPIYRNKAMIGFITFYITDNLDKFIKADSWAILDDNPQGKICYLAQVITDKNPDNARLSYKIWEELKVFITETFPSVESLYWRRYDRKTNSIKTYSKEVKNAHCCLHA